MIKIWQAYACNNSSAARVVARFVDDDAAAGVVAELGEFFEAQSKSPRARALTTLARTYGFDWVDGGMGGDGPFAIAEGATVIVHHTQCLGLGPGVGAYLEDRGGTIVSERGRTLDISVLFRATPGSDPRLDAELAELFAQSRGRGDFVPWKAPWVQRQTIGEPAWFRDAGTVGIFFPCSPADLAHFKRWLADHRIEDPVITIEHTADRTLFDAIAAARCTACEGPLDYLDPRLHDIEIAQLVCRACGGLYDLAAFTTP